MYSKSLAAGLKKIVRGHIDSIRQFPNSRFAQALPALMSLSRPTMFQFDSLISVHSAGPFRRTHSMTCGHYAYSLNHDMLDAIRIRFLALSSHNDPFAQCTPQDYNWSEWFTLVVTTEATTWAGSSLVGLQIAGPGIPCSSGSGKQERIYGWCPEKQGRLSGETAGWVGGGWERPSWLSRD